MRIAPNFTPFIVILHIFMVTASSWTSCCSYHINLRLTTYTVHKVWQKTFLCCYLSCYSWCYVHHKFPGVTLCKKAICSSISPTHAGHHTRCRGFLFTAPPTSAIVTTVPSHNRLLNLSNFTLTFHFNR